MALLELDRASKSYGDLRVLDDLSLQVDRGEILGIIGPNGAGKTTALSVIAGDVPAASGEVRFDGQDVTRLPVHHRSSLGIGRTFQVPRPFTTMSVFENVLIGATHGGKKGGDPAAAAVEALARTRLLQKANAKAGALTLLERKRLELARAIVTKPRLMLLDESAGGLSEAELEELLPTIAEIKGDGTAVIWVEHVIHALLAMADRVICLDRGRKLLEDRPNQVMASQQVQDVYLGAMVS